MSCVGRQGRVFAGRIYGKRRPSAGVAAKRGWVILLCLLPLLLVAGRATAQQPPRDVAWRLFVDGEARAWTAPVRLPPDSLDGVARRALREVQRAGYLLAVLDSVALDTAATQMEARLYVTAGPEVRVGRVRIEGAAALDSLALLDALETRAGRVLDAEVLEADVAAVLARYEARGFALAQVRIAALDLRTDGPPRLDVLLRITEGPALRLSGVELVGEGRTRPAFAAHLAGLSPGQPLAGYDPAEVRRRLQETGFFTDVGAPTLLVRGDTAVVVRIPVEEGPPGAFDLVLGYVPTPGAGGTVVGNGHLALHNLFGAGRAFSAKLSRLPGQASRVEAEASDPFVAGLPLHLGARFTGLQQDSTFGTQRYRAEAAYLLGRSLSVAGTYSREATRPGQHGLAFAGGRQRVARADAWFAGLAVRYQRLDRLVNPGRGVLVETELERGRQTRLEGRATAGDTTAVRRNLHRQRLQATLRAYVPARRRQVIVLGLEGAVLLSEAYDRSDLFRFGGATSLRGYNEDQFEGRAVGRALLEYRLQVDRASYAYLFFDVGYIDTPPLSDASDGRYTIRPGYGLGMQYRTGLGLVNVSGALNPEDGPTAVRIHAGLSFGL